MADAKVGDVVRFQDVPRWTLIRDRSGDYALRQAPASKRSKDDGQWVFCEGDVDWAEPEPLWPWTNHTNLFVTIIAVGLNPATTTARTLREAAERFEAGRLA